MKIVGIIAEYNPFHSGHRYHIEKTREAGATHIVAVMSPSVVQRGDVAVLDAHFRARAAVMGGVDLVLELPPQYALSAARDFARAGVGIIKRLGCVSMLSFGAENDDIGALYEALEALKGGEQRIKLLMSAGLTYPQAAAKALGERAAEIIVGRNNTLALEYLRALGDSGIQPLAIKRTVEHDGEKTAGGYASASKIREILREGGSADEFLGCSVDRSDLSFIENGERAILFRLSAMSKEDFAKTPCCGELAGRFFSASRRASGLSEFYAKVKSRNFTLARVRRATLAAALGIRLDDMFEPPYARVLALSERGAEVLRECRKTADIPIGSSLAELSEISREAKRQAELTELASRLRSLCRRDVLGPTEYEKSGKIVRGVP